MDNFWWNSTQMKEIPEDLMLSFKSLDQGRSQEPKQEAHMSPHYSHSNTFLWLTSLSRIIPRNNEGLGLLRDICRSPLSLHIFSVFELHRQPLNNLPLVLEAYMHWPTAAVSTDVHSLFTLQLRIRSHGPCLVQQFKTQRYSTYYLSVEQRNETNLYLWEAQSENILHFWEKNLN